MVEVAAFLLCDRAERDDGSGKWTLRGLFDVVWVETFPAVHDRLDAYLRLRLGDGARDRPLQLTFVCRSPSGVEQQSPPSPLRVTALGTAEAVCRFEGVPFDAPGSYVVEARLDGAVVGSTGLTVARARGAAEPLH